MIGHRLMGLSLLVTGDVVKSRMQLDQAITLYDPAEHRSLAARFGQDVRMASLSLRAWGLAVLGLYDAALADTERALKDAREIDQAATSMYALLVASITQIICGNFAAAFAHVNELIALTDKTGSSFWGAWGIMQRGCLLALTGKPSEAVETITSGLAAWRSTGSTAMKPWYLAYLAWAHVALGQFEDAERCVCEAISTIETTKERWCEAEVDRIAGEIALLSPKGDTAKGEAYFKRALALAREQQARSWELRTSIRMAQLWRNQGKRQQAHDLLSPICEWFTQGFNPIDMKQAKSLLDELKS
jgi:predicted ATPase